MVASKAAKTAPGSSAAQHREGASAMAKQTDDGERYVPTVQEIEEGRSEQGGYTRATVEKWGVPWPLQKGWRKRLLAEAARHHPPDLRAKPGYLVRIRGGVAHVWTGSDTACRQYSTGGIKNRHRYTVTDTPDGRQVCKNCRGAVGSRGKAFGGSDVDDPRQIGLWSPTSLS